MEGLKNPEHKIIHIVTSPDKKAGRGLEMRHSLIKEFAIKNKIPVFQPVNINNPDAIKFLKKINPDIFIVIAYGKILKKEILDIPKFMSINVHASMLPKYRGAAPINWAIANGEKETGITIIKMNEFMDEGDIILQKKIKIEKDMDASLLAEIISEEAPEVLKKALDLISSEKAKFVAQNEKFATYASKLKREDGLIIWNNAAEMICNRVRAFVPWPGSYTYFNKLMLKIWKVDLIKNNAVGRNGEIVEISKDGMVVATKKDCVLIRELQPEAKKKMTAAEFVNGYNINRGNVLG